MTCRSGKSETLEHMLMECEVYDELREKWWGEVDEVMGGGLGEFVNPFAVILGSRTGISVEGRARVLAASSHLFVDFVWSKRTNVIHGQYTPILGIKDACIMIPEG